MTLVQAQQKKIDELMEQSKKHIETITTGQANGSKAGCTKNECPTKNVPDDTISPQQPSTTRLIVTQQPHTITQDIGEATTKHNRPADNTRSRKRMQVLL